MNKYFKELMDRLNKSSDIPVAFKPNELVISKEIAFAIISDINRRYNNCLWRNKIVSFPKNIYGESSRPVLVKYKDKNTDPRACNSNGDTENDLHKHHKRDRSIGVAGDHSQSDHGKHVGHGVVASALNLQKRSSGMF